MAEALGGVVQGYVVMAAGEDGIEKQRVDVGLEIPAVHLDGKLIPQDQSDSEGVVLVVIVPVPLGGQDDLLQGNKVLIGDAEGYIGDHLHPLGDQLLSPGAPDRLAVILAVGADHAVDGGERLAFAEQSGIGHQLSRAIQVILPAADIQTEIPTAVNDQQEGMEKGAAEGGKQGQGGSQGDQDQNGHETPPVTQITFRCRPPGVKFVLPTQNRLPFIISSASFPITRNTPDTRATPTATVSR